MCLWRMARVGTTVVLFAVLHAGCAKEKSVKHQARAQKSQAGEPTVPTPPVAKASAPCPAAGDWYEVVDTNDLSYAGVTRLQVRIRLREQLTNRQLRRICEEVICRQKKVERLNAISFLFYLPDTDTRGGYTAGKADWAPDGDWAEAGSVRTGDYSRHRLRVEAEPLFESPPVADETIPEMRRRMLFFDLVKAQDDGVGDERAYSVVAEEYEIEESVVWKIAVEGAQKGWSVP